METYYTFNTGLAVQYGVGEAIILNAIATTTVETITSQGKR